MVAPSPPSDLTPLSADELRALVTDLVAQPRAVREEDAALKDQIARLKGLKGRPRLRPSGIEPATAAAARRARGRTRRRGRGAKTSRLMIGEERVLTVTPPPPPPGARGSRAATASSSRGTHARPHGW